MYVIHRLGGPLGEAVPEVEGTVSPNTDRPRPVNNIFIFFFWDLKVSGKFSFTLQPVCDEVGHVSVDEAHDTMLKAPGKKKQQKRIYFGWIIQKLL